MDYCVQQIDISVQSIISHQGLPNIAKRQPHDTKVSCGCSFAEENFFVNHPKGLGDILPSVFC